MWGKLCRSWISFSLSVRMSAYCLVKHGISCRWGILPGKRYDIKNLEWMGLLFVCVVYGYVPASMLKFVSQISSTSSKRFWSEAKCSSSYWWIFVFIQMDTFNIVTLPLTHFNNELCQFAPTIAHGDDRESYLVFFRCTSRWGLRHRGSKQSLSR